MRRGRVHLLGQRPEGDAAVAQIGDDRQKMRQRAPQPVELPDHQRIAFPQPAEAGRETRAVIPGARSLVGMDVALIDPGGDQRVALEID